MSRQRASILVVDDEPDICANLQDILSDFGYCVDTAGSGEAALELLEQQPYDVALLDLKMPGMSGLELYQRIKRRHASTVALIVTAYAGTETARAATDAGAWKVIAKPVELPELLNLVDQILDQPLVMLVDDDHDLCASLWDVLRQHNFRVCLAHDAEQAATQLQQRRYDVVLIDMKLPKGDGPTVFRLVSEANPEARTLAITGHRDETELQIQQILKSGGSGVCYKPFDMHRLLETIENLSQNRP